MPSVAQVLTAYKRSSDDSVNEFLVGLFDSYWLAQNARSLHNDNNHGKYEYLIEPWIIDGRYEEVRSTDGETE